MRHMFCIAVVGRACFLRVWVFETFDLHDHTTLWFERVTDEQEKLTPVVLPVLGGFSCLLCLVKQSHRRIACIARDSGEHQ